MIKEWTIFQPPPHTCFLYINNIHVGLAILEQNIVIFIVRGAGMQTY